MTGRKSPASPCHHLKPRARQHIVDGVDTETGEVLEDHNENFGNESNSPSPATAPAPELTVVATMPSVTAFLLST